MTRRNYVASIPKRKGSAVVAINSWADFFSTRLNYVEVSAGQEAVVVVEPVRITASDGFKELDVAKRECLMSNEQKVRFMRLY